MRDIKHVFNAVLAAGIISTVAMIWNMDVRLTKVETELAIMNRRLITMHGYNNNSNGTF